MSRYNSRKSFEKLVGLQTNISEESNLISTEYKSHFRGWVTLGEKTYFFKSIWEVRYGAYLEWLRSNGQIKDWEYESQKFTFPKEDYDTDPFLYWPDFKVILLDDSHSWHEVKGYMTRKSKKKITRFRKHYPQEKLYIIGAREMQDISKYRALIPGWMYFVPSEGQQKTH